MLNFNTDSGQFGNIRKGFYQISIFFALNFYQILYQNPIRISIEIFETH